jgi:tRNA (guanine37-N1)-methyltransferase
MIVFHQNSYINVSVLSYSMKVIKVEKIKAQKVKKLIISKEVLDINYNIESDSEYVYFPVLKEVKGFKIINKRLKKRVRFELKKELSKLLTKKELLKLKTSMEVLGGICILEIDESLVKKEKAIAELFLKSSNSIISVVKKVGIHSGKYRLQKHKFLAGARKKETTYLENGIKLKLNIDKVYFSSRLASDRLRIVNRIKKGEKVLVMFSGVGVYPITLSKYSKASFIYGVEINPEAHKYALENLKLNKIDNVKLFNGDVSSVLPSLKIKFDRILMPLPGNAYEFLELAKRKLKPRGIIDLYSFEHDLESIWSKIPFKFKKKEVWKCCQIAPRKYRVCGEFVVK